MPRDWALPLLLAEGGPFMPLILLTAFAGAVLAVERLLVWIWWRWRDRPFYRASSREELLAALDMEVRLERKELEPATPLGAVLLHAHAQLQQQGPLQPAEREELLAPLILARLPVVEARLATIAWIANVLPMMGLLGTVSGLIATFTELAQTTSRQVLSQGLSEALWTTEVGLLGALYLLAHHHLLSVWRDRWLNQLERGLALLAGGNGNGSQAWRTAPRGEAVAPALPARGTQGGPPERGDES